MFKSIERWLWIRMNRKPPRAYNCYMGIAGNWIIVGWIFILGSVLLMALLSSDSDIAINNKSVMIAFSVILIFLAVYLGYTAVRSDKKYGYYDAIHKASLDDWHRKRKEYGLE